MNTPRKSCTLNPRSIPMLTRRPQTVDTTNSIARERPHHITCPYWALQAWVKWNWTSPKSNKLTWQPNFFSKGYRLKLMTGLGGGLAVRKFQPSTRLQWRFNIRSFAATLKKNKYTISSHFHTRPQQYVWLTNCILQTTSVFLRTLHFSKSWAFCIGGDPWSIPIWRWLAKLQFHRNLPISRWCQFT